MIVTLEENEDGELILPITPELLDELGWDIDDTLSWNITEDGTVSISKID